MLAYLVILFLLLPFVDLYLLMQIASEFGLIYTVFFIIVTGVVGAAVIKREGLGVLRRLSTSVTAKEVSRNMLEVLMLLLGGIMLLSPGFITDFLGFLFVLGPTRQRLVVKISERLEKDSDIKFKIHRF